MKFQIDRIDRTALEANKPYSKPLAVADGPQAAAIAACAFARHFGAEFNVSVSLKGKGISLCEYSTMIGARWGFDDGALFDKLEGFVKTHRAKQRRTARIMAFYRRFQPDIHTDYQGWEDANKRMDDGAFRTALWAERYDEAAARAAELGLVDRTREAVAA